MPEVRYQTMWRGMRSNRVQSTYRWRWLAHAAILVPNIVLTILQGDGPFWVRKVSTGDAS